MLKPEVRPAATARQRGESPKSERRPKSEDRTCIRELREFPRSTWRSSRGVERQGVRDARPKLCPNICCFDLVPALWKIRVNSRNSRIRLRTSDFSVP